MTTPVKWSNTSASALTNEWQQLFRGRKTGDVVDFAGGKMTINVNGDPTTEGAYSGNWVSPDGQSVQLNRVGQGQDARANANKAIADYYYNKYGFVSGQARLNNNIASGGEINPYYGTAADMQRDGMAAPKQVAGIYSPTTGQTAGSGAGYVAPSYSAKQTAPAQTGFGVGGTPPAATPVSPPAPGGLVGAADNWMKGAAYDASKIPSDFDWRAYASRYGDFAAAGIDTEEEARRHYANYGIAEGRKYKSNTVTPDGPFGVGGTPGQTPGQGANPPGPANTTVTPEMSVEERAAAIAATDSPLMQQARGRAMQQMNERGLINSSLGIQAGQEAVLDRATDIAKADAQTEFQNSQNNANRAQQLEIAQLQAQTSLQNAQISASTQLQVAEINRQYSQMANLSSTSASLLTAFNNDVNNIVLSDLPAEAKEAAINARTQTLRLSVNVMGSINGDVDMNKLLNQILG